MLDLILQVSDVLIIVNLVIVGCILALCVRLQAANRGHVLLLGLLGQQILLLVSQEGLDCIVGCVSTLKLGLGHTTHLIDH